MLAGGASTRMGRDKALLPYRGTTLVKYVAAVVQQAAGAVFLIGDPARYADTGYPVYPDKIPHCGPMGGIYTALSLTTTDWNLVVACDMPKLSPPVLRHLLECASAAAADCVAGSSDGSGPEPLCAVYHRRCLPALARSISHNLLKMKDLLSALTVKAVLLEEPSALANVNTPGEWLRFDDLPV